MNVQYDSYITKKVNSFKFCEYTNDLMVGDCVEGANGFTHIEREPDTIKVKHYYVLEHNGNTTMVAPDVYIKMSNGEYKLAEEISKNDSLYPKQVVQYIGHAPQPLYMTKVVTEDNTLKVNGLYIKGGK